MARLSIDDSLARDPRLEDLAELCGWSRRETAGCLQLDVWPLCYDRVTPNLRARDIDRAANRDAVAPVKHPGGFAAALIQCGLGRPATKRDSHYTWIKNDGSVVQLPWKDHEWRDRIYVSGAADRIAYLLKKEESGRAGGTRSSENRRNQKTKRSSTASSTASSSASRGASSTGSPSANPSASASASADPPDRASASATGEASSASPAEESPALPEFRERVDAGAAASLEARVSRVLNRLTQSNGVTYTSAEHFELVRERLRSGITELELRAVIAYCAEDLNWAHEEKMLGHLNPHTLFGPSLSKYLDPARSVYADEIKRGAA